ncbi:MAG: nicotinate phosphoribosyltransferase [Nitrospirota bacterium]
MFHTANPKDILEGKITDVYFDRTLQILKKKGIDKKVKAEFIVKSLPGGWEWAVLAGIEECAGLLKRLNVNVRAMKEGTIFKPYQPVMEIEGMYTDFGVYETATLGLLCQASGIATKSARCKMLAGEKKIISFGARRMHPILAPMIERNAYIGGCDGVAVIKSAELIEEEPIGTMPHALIIILGSSLAATKAFDEVIEPHIKRVALVDTFEDEKFESIRAAEGMGGKLFAVRLDTPSSRRGDFYRIIEEVRWELDIRGFKDVKIFVSGGINEEDIVRLNPVVDAYGIGTSISNAPVIDFAMDIIEVEGKPLAKRGKWSGSKSVLRCNKCFKDKIIPYTTEKISCECGGYNEELLIPFIMDGKILYKMPKPRDIRKYVLSQCNNLRESKLGTT